MLKRWVERSAPSAVLNTTKILVAAKELAYATKLSDAEFKLVDWPTSHLPSAYLSNPKDAVNKITTRALVSGEVLSKHNIKEYVGGNPLSALIQPDMRAVTVKVNDVIGVSGFLLPGNFVDVLATPKIRSYSTNNAKANVAATPTTYIAVQNVKVLAVDQDTGGDKNKPPCIRASRWKSRLSKRLSSCTQPLKALFNYCCVIRSIKPSPPYPRT
ncbi:Flp pilus assembly protein CpaB [Methylocucumis oryzae]|uniref:SAF domain-containing protein n=1 Tax=Methylocucumis oryzae TaxID=1632867 RepID=A0A0F3IGQ7_9GAMM|nr:Flp pilus assembly protein CpaB [Methylocucumis oryzae]KJV05887.1 hypothetical protein VZ94_14895 [Methylocucumis oryzae]